MEDTQQGATQLTPIEILFTYKGRIGVGTFWGYYLGGVVIGIIVVLGLAAYASPENYEGILVVVWLVSVWISTALVVKRLHDSGRHGALVFILLIPLVNLIWLIVLGTFPTEGPNQYGRPPREYRNTTARVAERSTPVPPRVPTSRKKQELDDRTQNWDWRVRASTATESGTPQSALAVLAVDKTAAVRIAVSNNASSGRTVLEKMAEEDSDSQIRRNARETLDGLGPEEPSDRPEAVTMDELRAELRAANESEADKAKAGSDSQDVIEAVSDSSNSGFELAATSPTDDEPNISEGADVIELIPPNLIDDLERLAGLYKQGMLSEEEFNLLKSRLI